VQVVESPPKRQDAGLNPRGWTIRVRSDVNQNYSNNVICICAASVVSLIAPTATARRRKKKKKQQRGGR
jgi:hypothetical protein